MSQIADGAVRQNGLLRTLTCLMFFSFAMTTDAVGSVIPNLVSEFKLSLKAAGAFQYVTMSAIAVGAVLLGFLADRLGRKLTIILGLSLYCLGSLLFAFGTRYSTFVVLLAISGIGISIFKVGGLALVGDLSTSSSSHTRFMNTIEGFFGVGAIVGPALVALLISRGMSWKWLYVVAAIICGVLVCVAALARFPTPRKTPGDTSSLAHTFKMMTNPYAMGFSVLIALYVLVEVAIYVWMPSYLQSYTGAVAWLPLYALTIFFVLRAAGRFMGVWLLGIFPWTAIMCIFGLAIFLCFAGSLAGGVKVGAWLLPLSGLFMSMIYPTLNSKGISCFHQDEHGAVAGVMLFFTAVAAALGPLAMAAVSDAYGDIKFGFVLATVFALLLCVGLLYNWISNPTQGRLRSLDQEDYHVAS
jgi:MFS transporter, DHA1 family, quinolone resistance protein